MPDRYRALVLVGAYAGLRWGEAAGLTRCNVDGLRSRIRVISTAVEVRGHVTLGQEPKTRRSRRTVPVARSVMRQLEAHMAAFVAPEPDALVFTAPQGGPLRRSLFSRRVWRPRPSGPGSWA
jgi:integrase